MLVPHVAAGISAAADAPASGPELRTKASHDGSQADHVSSASSDLDDSELDLLADDSSSSSQHGAEGDGRSRDGSDGDSTEARDAQYASQDGGLAVDIPKGRPSTPQGKTSSQKGTTVADIGCIAGHWKLRPMLLKRQENWPNVDREALKTIPHCCIPNTALMYV